MHEHEQSAEYVIKSLKTDSAIGLSKSEAESRLLKYGKNVLDEEKKKSVFMRFFKQFDDFMIIILLIAAAISFAMSMAGNDKNITEPLIILAIVIINAVLGTVQEVRAEHSLAQLKKLSSPDATVIRDGKETRIKSYNVVPGDIVKFKSGDMVCADCRLIKSNSLTTDESTLTGEATEVMKDAEFICPEYTPLAEMKNTVMQGCAVTGGEGTGVVIRTGMKTEVGRIANMLMHSDKDETPLQKRLKNVGKTLGILALFICGIIFIIGTIKHIPPLEMFMTSVSLAVAAIPEGLPAIVTILLALGVMRMSKHNAIVKNLPSVETLGCATVICTDKTGTLTENKMQVSQVKTLNLPMLLRMATLCTESGEYINATDNAILNYASKNGVDTAKYKNMHKISAYEPFSSTKKRMAVAADGKCIIKGAPESIIPLCTKYQSSDEAVLLSHKLKRDILSENDNMAKNALRVIAVAYKPEKSHTITENDMIFLGLIGIFDAPRHEAKEAVNVAKTAGIRTIMITGDHLNTALAIAKKTGIASADDKGVTGAEIDKADDKELSELLKTHNVFARVTPEHKLRIVNVLKKNGEICAMTGDGVNDAPALKGADIGCSMGINGTDVAKAASDIVLTDDNYATIVYAVKEGRSIYDNIKKSVKFLLSSNIGEILTVLFGIIYNSVSPLNAIELLWINLVTDSFPALALGFDPPESDIMQKPRKNTKNRLFSGGLWASITLEGLMIGALSLFSYALGLIIGKSRDAARTTAFFVLAVSQLTHAFNMRSEKSVLNREFFKNKYLVLSFIIGVSAQLILVYFPPAASLFDVTPLSPACLAIALVMSFMPLLIVETQKKLNSYFFRRK